MPVDKHGGFIVSTLGDFVDLGSTLSAFCAHPPVGCGRQLDLDVYDLAWLFGRRSDIHSRFPLKCAGCGCRRLEWRRSGDERPGYSVRELGPKNYRSSRSLEERAALRLLYPMNPWGKGRD